MYRKKCGFKRGTSSCGDVQCGGVHSCPSRGCSPGCSPWATCPRMTTAVPALGCMGKFLPASGANIDLHRARYFPLGLPHSRRGGPCSPSRIQFRASPDPAGDRTASLLPANAPFGESDCTGSCGKVAQSTTPTGEMTCLVNMAPTPTGRNMLAVRNRLPCRIVGRLRSNFRVCPSDPPAIAGKASDKPTCTETGCSRSSSIADQTAYRLPAIHSERP